MRTGYWTLAPQGTFRFCNAKGNCSRCSGVGKTGPPPCWQPACLPPGLGGSMAVFLRVWAQLGSCPLGLTRTRPLGSFLKKHSQVRKRKCWAFKVRAGTGLGEARERASISPGWERTLDCLSLVKLTGCVWAPSHSDLRVSHEFCPLFPLPGPGICLVPVPLKTDTTHRLCPLPGPLQPLSTGAIPQPEGQRTNVYPAGLGSGLTSPGWILPLCFGLGCDSVLSPGLCSESPRGWDRWVGWEGLPPSASQIGGLSQSLYFIHSPCHWGLADQH